MLGPVTVNNDTGMAQAQSSQEKYRQALSFLRLSQEKVKEWESGRSETVSRRKKKSRRGTAQAPETLIREELGDEISMEMSQSQSSASISLSNMAVMDMPALPGMFQEYSDSQALFSADEDEE